MRLQKYVVNESIKFDVSGSRRYSLEYLYFRARPRVHHPERGAARKIRPLPARAVFRVPRMDEDFQASS